MSIEVIGAGFGRTGTLSLKFALEKLGFDKCYHMMEVERNPGHAQIWIDAARGIEPDWHRLFEGYKASVDWPSCNFWREQMAAFPQAKVILTRRDPKSWYKSVMSTIWPASNRPRDTEEGRLGRELAFGNIWRPIFDERMDDEAHVIAQYEAHNQRVIEGVPADKLLVYEPGQGWAPICEFLGVPEPDEPYPKTNTTEQFTQLWRQLGEESKDKNKSQ